jgi:hypothetical protein
MADINTVKTQLNTLLYGQRAGAGKTAALPGDANGNLLLNGKSDASMVAAIRLFQAAHGLIVNGLLGAGTLAALQQAYTAQENADTAMANQKASGQPIAYLVNGPGGQAQDTAGNVVPVQLPQYDAAGNITSDGTLNDQTDPVPPTGQLSTANIAAAQTAAANRAQQTQATIAMAGGGISPQLAAAQAGQVAALGATMMQPGAPIPGATGSPGGYPGAPGLVPVPYVPPSSGLPWWACGGFGLVAFGGIAAVQAAKKKKLAKAAGH